MSALQSNLSDYSRIWTFQTGSKYLVLSITVALIVIAFAVWLPNLHLITRTMANSSMTVWQKTNLLASLLGSLQTNFSPFSRMVTIVSAALAGIQTSLLTFYLRQAVQLQQSMGVSVVGIATSLLGVGCASCGSVILTSLIGLGSTTAVLGLLPFRGQEIGIMGIGVLLLAVGLTVKKINQPFACQPKEKK